MKRKTKRILGSCGLLAVATMTVAAAFVPTPETSAVSTETSTTDTITVRVVPSSPDVSMTAFDSNGNEMYNGAIVTNPNIILRLEYASVDDLRLDVAYENFNGDKRNETIDEWEVQEIAGEREIQLNVREILNIQGEIVGVNTSNQTFELANVSQKAQTAEKVGLVDVSQPARSERANIAVVDQRTGASFRLAANEDIPFTYGHYKLTFTGTDSDGYFKTYAFEFYYVPVQASLSENEDGTYTLDLEYEYDNDTPETAGFVKRVEVSVIDEDGNIKLGPFNLQENEKQLALDLKKLGAGTYTVVVRMFGRDGEELYKSIKIGVTVKANGSIDIEEPDLEVPNAGIVGSPDTGRFGGKLNISKIDYLITGLVVFGIVVIAGFVFVAKGDKQKSTRKRK